MLRRFSLILNTLLRESAFLSAPICENHFSDSMAEHNKKGKEGEKLAAKYIRDLGYQIIKLNWRYKHKEIDIIAKDGGELVIVEVKLRSTDFYGDPSEAVTLKKQKYLVEAAEAYLDTIDEAPEVRFDIVSIVGSDPNYTFEHITDAFNP